ncbi:hypothetical protein EDE08_103322 [Bradyrhizobium sp. R2.2-H]|jgi:hypothetical protein|uniref:hypothetical protein n=1 Tax=unclassified Bradyrhizobium TaxID=2631580 RepID=UPI0010489595|nr:MULTISPECIES: hypothetical protein [unclassified Bradyrhizobium]TCU75105.1 hypothetical protein EDE10_103321 [Bradyrhizobium sp. Y-H1]TCU77873.1 hypothetical protein EDE08_103322 [Bradyrhizobium sp. R2.2-H]
MTDQLKQIVIDFEAEVLRAVANGGKQPYIERAMTRADDKLRAMQAGADADLLEAIFSAAIEIETKSKMAMKAIAA